jgi:hypothetical protein
MAIAAKKRAKPRQRKPKPMSESVQIPTKQVRVVVTNLLDRTVSGNLLDDLSFHYRGPGDQGEPVMYKLRLNEEQVIPKEVAEHLKNLGYDQYRQHERRDDATGRILESYPVRIGKQARFMVTIVGDA